MESKDTGPGSAAPEDNGRVTVYYDGACPGCVRDRCNYERIAGESGRDVDWLDITGRETELRAAGIDPERALLELHVRGPDGRIHAELDAYIVLMRRTPLLRPLAWLLGLRWLRPWLAGWYRRHVDARLKREGRHPHAPSS